MLDLFSHFAALDVLRGRLLREALDGAGPEIVDAQKAVEAHSPCAALGSVVDHLIAHDGTSDVEISVLTEALNLFNRLRSLIHDYRSARATIEQLAVQPGSANALSRYNQARSDLAVIFTELDTLVAEMQGFEWARLRSVQYLMDHPQNGDTPVGAWPWRDIVLSRRTGTFAATTIDLARQSGRDDALAFAVGVLASYAGNAIGSQYLTRSVGGPRRSHKLRDRVASYSVGAWLRHIGTFPEFPLQGSPTTTLAGLGIPAQSILPQWLAELIGQALRDTYGEVAGFPDLTVAYRNLMYHWKLLHSFQLPSPPAPTKGVLAVRIANSSLKPEDVNWPDNPPPAAGPAPGGGSGGNILDPGPGMPPWFLPAHETAEDYLKEFLLDLLLLPIFLARSGFYGGHKLFDKKPKPGQTVSTGQAVSYLSSSLSQAEYDAVMASPDILIAVKAMGDADLVLFSLITHWLRILKLYGLIYPAPQDLSAPEFSQFVAPPPVPAQFHWPARPQPLPTLSVKFPLQASTENTSTPAAFATGEKPAAFLIGGQTPAPWVARDGYDIVVGELTNRPDSAVRTTNINLDADRGPGEACWQLTPGTSMTDDPVNVAALAYPDI